MLAIAFYDVVLWVHITAVLVAFGSLFAYPILLGVNAKAPIERRAPLHHGQIAYSKRVTGPVIGVVLIAGMYMATDRSLWSEPWVSGSFVLLLVVAGMGATVLRQAEMGLVNTAESGDEAGYATALADAKKWTIAIAALVVLTVFLMTVKPFG